MVTVKRNHEKKTGRGFATVRLGGKYPKRTDIEPIIINITTIGKFVLDLSWSELGYNGDGRPRADIIDC